MADNTVIFTANQEYEVNSRVSKLVRAYFIFGGLSFLGASFLKNGMSFVILGAVFIGVALLANYKFPEKIYLSKKNIGIKTVLSKAPRIFENNNLKIDVDKKGKKFYLRLDRKYILSIAFIPERLFTKLNKYVEE